MSCGAAITCSNSTAMPETCQEAAMYFDPNNTKEMAKKIELLMKDKELRNSLKEKMLWENNTHFFIFVQIDYFSTFFEKPVQSKIALVKISFLVKNKKACSP